MTPEERSAIARIGAHTSWARTPNRAERTEPARRASPGRIEFWLDRPERLDPLGVMSPEDRLKAAQSAVRAHMSQLRHKRTQKAKAQAETT